MSVDIVNLIESNPITKLNGNYQSKLIQKVKNTFTEYEQQIFLASFYCYLNYDRKNDFVIDLDNVWKWLGFGLKVNAKRVLEKNFIINKDYILLPCQVAKQTNYLKGGHNKEIFMLNINTFKKFCLKAETKKADEIHEYYIKLEETFQEVIEEESNELKTQLEQKNVEIKNIETDKEKIREKTLLEHFMNNVQCVYYGVIENVSDKNEKLVKFGNSNHLKNRVITHKDTYINFRLINAFKVDNKLQIENALKENSVFMERQRTIIVKNKKYIELLSIDGLTFTELDKIIKDIIINIEYSPENYKRILEDNKSLKKQIEENNENNNTNNSILLSSENKRLKIENIKLVKKYEVLLKKINQEEKDILKQELEFIVEEAEIENYEKTNNKINNIYKKNKDGSYIIDGNKYEKLFGTRDDVWNNIAYKTRGNLIKKEFMLNKSGKVVSKKKFIQETINNRFEKYGVNKPNENSKN
jgi:hypothetical protein